MTLPKVLVGVVTYEGKDYIWNKFSSNLKNLSYPNHDILFVDNTKNKRYTKKINKEGFECIHVKRGETSRESQADSLNVIRKRFIDGGYDYLMLIESDLIPPKDIIERLMSHNKLVVGCIYLIGYDYSDSQPPRPCLFSARKDKNGKSETYNVPRGFDYFGKGLTKIHGCGFGTTLIHKNIINKFKFWYYLEGTVKHSDVLFYMDLHNNGYSAYVDTNIIIPHFNSDWKDVKDI